ncbi:MAG: hypothetical protein ABIH48_01555 [Candidatus Falkowbacteria bacterium]
MATIYKCDKCNKTIKEDHKRFDCMNWGVQDYDMPSHFILCKKCCEPFAKYVQKLLGIKKIKK